MGTALAAPSERTGAVLVPVVGTEQPECRRTRAVSSSNSISLSQNRFGLAATITSHCLPRPVGWGRCPPERLRLRAQRRRDGSTSGHQVAPAARGGLGAGARGLHGGSGPGRLGPIAPHRHCVGAAPHPAGLGRLTPSPPEPWHGPQWITRNSKLATKLARKLSGKHPGLCRREYSHNTPPHAAAKPQPQHSET